jgi:hypothetical protein
MRTIRFGIAMVAVLVSLPTWASDASLDAGNRQVIARRAGDKASSPTKQDEQERAAHERFLNEIWTAS